jgi:pimeloyl-ACP methyl ester carboxylesterase
MTTPVTHSVNLRPDLPITLTESGSGRPALVLHGGGGPFTVVGIAEHLAQTMHAITPTHPGWNGTPRPDWVSGIDDIALAYLGYLEDKDLRDVLVVGSSLGGWIGAEMATRDDAGRISGLILLDPVGVDVDGQPIRDFFALDAREIAEYSFHDANRFYVDPVTVSDEQAARQRANMATMRIVAGEPYMHDPTLFDRLGRIEIPVLVIWGDSDRIVTPAYGAAYAAAFGQARLEIVREAGHLPQLEQPVGTFALIDDYVRQPSTSSGAETESVVTTARSKAARRPR